MNHEYLSDDQLIAAVTASVSVPRREPANSFVLHAPLELLARRALLPQVSAAARPQARTRIAEIADQWHASDAIEPAPVPEIRDRDHALDALARAMAASDLDAVDGAALWLADHLDADALTRALAPDTVARLSAAAHAPIYLFHAPRVASDGSARRLIRPQLRELARHPEWRLSWIDGLAARRAVAALGDASDLFAAMAAVPRLGAPGSDFIYPLMDHAERGMDLVALLGTAIEDASISGAARCLLRAAARSMLAEAPQQVPYGWTHCLTMPLGALGIARHLPDPRIGIAVAATYVAAFRAAYAQHTLDENHALDENAAVPDSPPWPELIDDAAAHHDAHVVKYIHACVVATELDPDADALYRAASHCLLDWWAAHPDAGFTA